MIFAIHYRPRTFCSVLFWSRFVSSCPWFFKDTDPYRTNSPHAPFAALSPPTYRTPHRTPPRNPLALPPSPSPTFFPKERNQTKSNQIICCSCKHVYVRADTTILSMRPLLRSPPVHFFLVLVSLIFALVSVSFVSFVHPTCSSPPPPAALPHPPAYLGFGHHTGALVSVASAFALRLYRMHVTFAT